MKVKKVVSFGIVVAMMIVGGVLAVSGCMDSNNKEYGETVPISAMTNEEKADRIVDKMTDEDMIGQIIFIGVHGKSLNSDMNYMISAYKPGGIILFDRNMESKEQVKRLLAGLKEAVADNKNIPLFLGIDQEGGAVARMQDKLVKVPAASELGKEPVETVKSTIRASAAELKELGFNINFAPVVDIGLTYGRSYSDTDVQKIITYADAVGKTYNDEKLAFSLKHFPGIGRVRTDLHEEGDHVNVSWAELQEREMLPYRSLIPQLPKNKYMIMVSHAVYDDIDSKYPASLSSIVITNILRQQLGFKGVVITDDMDMGAIAKDHSFSNIGVECIKAGADMIMVCHEYDHAKEVYEGILQAVKSGVLSRDEVKAHVKRIILMKLETGIITTEDVEYLNKASK